MPSNIDIQHTRKIEAYLAQRWSTSRRFQDYVRSLWADYSQLDVVDRDHVVSQLVNNDDEQFWQRLWEFQLGSHLFRLGLHPRSLKKGPDFRFEKDGQIIWVEAISPSPRRIPKAWFAVPVDDSGMTYNFPHEEILLCYTGAFAEKRRKFNKYVADRTISPQHACVIAVNGSQLSGIMPTPHGISTKPWAVEVVFPVGPRTVTFFRNSDRVDWENAERHEIRNRNDQSIELYPFLTPKFAGISALITCDDRCPCDQRLHLYIAHNPRATVPIPLGTFGDTSEEWQATPRNGVPGEWIATRVK